jgi:hypothetical protein
VGDLFAAHYGYDETHYNFYRVVRVTATKAEVLPVRATYVQQGGPSETVTAGYEPADYDVLIGVNRGDVKRTKLCTVKEGYKGQPTIVLRSGQHWAHKVEEGDTFSVTGRGWGR